MREAGLSNMAAEAWKEEEATLAAYAARRHIPLGGTFELTARCSLRCKMCYIRLDAAQVDKIGRELTAAEWIRLGREAAKAGMLNLLLTGGEPLLRPDFSEIYRALCQMGFIITLNTNATLLSDEHVRLFAQYPPTAVAVTLYGASPETYEKICGDASGFEKTIRGLERLKELPVELEVRTTFVRDNMRELEAIRSIADRYTKRFAINFMVFKAVRGATADVEICRMLPEQCMDIDLTNYQYYKDLNSKDAQAINAMLEERLDEVPPTAENWPERDYGLTLPPAVLTCLAAKASFWISWDGKMLPCGSFASPYTRPLEEGFVTAWNRLPVLLEGIEHPAECLACELKDACPNCPANLQAETGEFDKMAPYLCALAKERANRWAHYYRSE